MPDQNTFRLVAQLARASALHAECRGFKSLLTDQKYMPYKDKDKQREYQRIRQQKNTVLYRQTVVEMFGGKCQECGYNKNILAFQLDHIVPILRKSNEKDLTKQVWRKVALGIIPMDGLQLLCANCHAIKTIGTDIKLFNNTQRNAG